MYILIDIIATPGDYIKHKHTGEIIHATQVDNGAVLYSTEELEFDIYREYWEEEEYVVLFKLADNYFDSDLINDNEIPVEIKDLALLLLTSPPKNI